MLYSQMLQTAPDNTVVFIGNLMYYGLVIFIGVYFLALLVMAILVFFGKIPASALWIGAIGGILLVMFGLWALRDINEGPTTSSIYNFAAWIGNGIFSTVPKGNLLVAPETNSVVPVWLIILLIYKIKPHRVRINPHSTFRLERR